MLSHIQASDLLLSRAAQADGFLDDCKGNGHHDRSICTDGHNTQRLNTQLAEAAAVEQAILNIEEAHSNGAPQAVCKVNTHGAHGIIDVKLQIQRLDDHIDQNTGDQTDEKRADAVNHIAGSRDSDQAGQ